MFNTELSSYRPISSPASATEGDVAQDDAQSDGHQEKWFEILLDGKPDADNSYHDHGEVSCRGVCKARIGQELIEVLYDEIHNLL